MGFKSSNYDNLPFHSCVQAAVGKVEVGKVKIEFHTFCCVCVFKSRTPQNMQQGQVCPSVQLRGGLSKSQVMQFE